MNLPVLDGSFRLPGTKDGLDASLDLFVGIVRKDLVVIVVDLVVGLAQLFEELHQRRGRTEAEGAQQTRERDRAIETGEVDPGATLRRRGVVGPGPGHDDLFRRVSRQKSRRATEYEKSEAGRDPRRPGTDPAPRAGG